MENQTGARGDFYGNEVLQEPSSHEDISQMGDIYDAPTGGELAYPKLDGILFPIVVANADAIASCRWMGGAEVSLTVALNNYYQAMTEENADQVIADVYDFLANQAQPAETIEEVEIKEDNQSSQTVQPAEKTNSEKPVKEVLFSQQLERNDRSSRQQEEAATSKQDQAHNEPAGYKAETAKGSVLLQRSMNNEKATTRSSTATVEKVAVADQPDLTISKVEPARHVKEDGNNRQTAPEMPVVHTHVVEPEPVVVLPSISDREPGTKMESDRIAVAEDELAVVEMNAHPSDGIEYISEEPSLQYPDVHDAGAVVDVLPPETEIDEASDGSLNMRIIDGDEDELTEVVFSYDDNEEGLKKINNVQSDRAVEDSSPEIWDEDAVDFIDSPAETIERTKNKHSDAASVIDVDYLQTDEAISMIESSIVQLSREFEDYESDTMELNQADMEELQKMLTKLLDDIELTSERAVSDVQQLDMEQYLDGETTEQMNEIMRAPTLYSRAKGLLFVVSALIKRLSSRTLFVGKSVLRLHTFDYKGDYQRIVSYS